MRTNTGATLLFHHLLINKLFIRVIRRFINEQQFMRQLNITRVNWEFACLS